MTGSPRILAIFDLDGTLVDAFGDIHVALNKSLAERGLPTHDLPTVRSFVGNGLTRLCERALPPGNAELAPQLAAAMKNHYAGDPVGHSRMYPMTREMLLDLRRLNVLTAVLSNKDEELTCMVARGLGFDKLLDAIRGAKPGVPLKPDPAAIHALQEELGAAETFMIGDHDPDWQAAEAAGVHFIGVAWGLQQPEELAKHGPVAHSAGEIVRLIQQVAGAER